MISHPDRQQVIGLIEQAKREGARLHKACAEIGISVRTYQRWRRGGVRADGRPTATRPSPSNTLSSAEREQILAICNAPEFASLPPGQIVPKLADRGEYIASESSFYRVLRAAKQQHHRGRSQAARVRGPAPSHCAKGPNQVWVWDVSWMPGPATGVFYYLHLILDLYSRKIVGWEVYLNESGTNAVALVRQAVLSERCLLSPLVLHADNGSPQKANILRVTLEKLGIEPSYSRPRVSNDNAFAEAMFRTTKYRPDYPHKGFETLQAAREWMSVFATWYNNDHCHRGIRYVPPSVRHAGGDTAMLEQRDVVYQAARARHPQRWSGSTRNWSPAGPVWLAPSQEDNESINLSAGVENALFNDKAA